jgi:putative SOS response-associated peptidase YedK
MCGRVVQADAPVEVAELVGARQLGLDLKPRYNVAPTMPLAVVVEREGERVLTTFRWGLIPPWAREARIGQRLINARGETVAEKPAFRAAFRRQRCLVPVDAYYEWQRDGTTTVPYAIRRRDRRPLVLAGLWATWRDPANGQPVETCAVVTTAANATVGAVHERMPVVLPEAAWEAWLDPGFEDLGALQAMLGPCPAEWLDAYRVSPRVNAVRNDSPELLEPAR